MRSLSYARLVVSMGVIGFGWVSGCADPSAGVEPREKSAPSAELTPSAEATPSATASTKAAEPASGELATPDVPQIFGEGEADRRIAEGASAVVELIDAGAEPKSPLVYELSNAASSRYELSIDMKVGLVLADRKAPPQPFPRVRATFEHSVEPSPGQGVEPSPGQGEARILAKVVDLSIDAPQGAVDPELADKMRPHLEGLTGVTLRYRMTADGRATELSFDSPDILPDPARQALDHMAHAVLSLVAPLPSEAVGKGARWRATTRRRSGGVDIVETTLYELLDRTDSQIELRLASRQSAANEDVTPPSVPRGTKTRLTEMDTTSKGGGTVLLGLAAPSRGETKTESAMTIRIAGDDGGTPLDQMRMRSSVRLSVTTPVPSPVPSP